MTTGSTEGIAAALLGLLSPATRSSCWSPTTTPTSQCCRWRGRTSPGHPARPGLRLDPDDPGPRSRPDPVSPAEQAAQPDGHRAHRGRAARRESRALALEHDLVVITDEVYEHLAFGRFCTRTSPSRPCPGMAERTLTLSSAGKSYSFTGWKVGWATGPADLVAGRAGRQAVADLRVPGPRSSPPWPGALDDEPDFPRHVGHGPPGAPGPAVRRPRPGPGCTPRVPEGTYFATTDIAHLGWEDALTFCHALPERAGVVAIPSPGLPRRRRGGSAPCPLGILQGGRTSSRTGWPGWPPPTCTADPSLVDAGRCRPVTS